MTTQEQGERQHTKAPSGLLLLAVLATGFLWAFHASAQVSEGLCVDRLASNPNISRESLRLAELQYECMQLRSGRRLLAGFAGLEHRPTVLLVHGLGDNAHRDWQRLIPTLAQRYRVIAIDLPGFGGSDTLETGYSFAGLAAVMDQLLEREHISRAHVVGHSLGGAASLYFAHAYPHRVDRLVLIDAAGILLKSVYVHHVSQIALPGIGIEPIDALVSRFDRTLNGLSRQILQRLESGFDFSGWLAANPAIRAALLGSFTNTEAALGLIEHDFTRAIRETKAPTTVIWGRTDHVSPLRVGTLLAGRLPNATLHVIDRASHMPMTETPEETLRLVLQGLTATGQQAVDSAPVQPARSTECIDEIGRVFSGNFIRLSLQNCREARIENARIETLVVTDSSIEMQSVTIVSPEDVALDISNSLVRATVLEASGDIAIRASNSQLDLAGVTLRANERAIQSVTPNRIYFSVSDITSPGFSGDVHRIWTE